MAFADSSSETKPESPPAAARVDQPGKVILVGAGPGDPGLLTLRAAERIRAADVLVYDRLIHDGVLALAKPFAEKIYMGKEPGHHARQDEIHTLLVEKALQGKTVVRLKGGDPFLFGRGGEEVEYLAEHGIPFEVIPGVSSCLSAPLSANIAVTHRESSSSVVIVTGHSADGSEDQVDWEAVARIGTAVFLMGVHNIETIVRNLLAAGRSPDTPAAMIQMAYCESARVVTGTLESIAAEVRRVNIEPPATLVVGEVVRLRERLRQLVVLHAMQKEVEV